jgi:3',5'-cyclic AMP phosphodiesterase CpdA
VTSTAEWRIARFSDTHVLSLEGATAREFLDKRATGAVNLAFNRAKQYRVELFEKLLEALVAPRPDHTVCTGDLARRGPGVGEVCARVRRRVRRPVAVDGRVVLQMSIERSRSVAAFQTERRLLSVTSA